MSVGIRSRTLFTVIVPLLLLALIMGFYFIRVRIDDARNELEMQGRRYGEYLAAASEFNVISGNHPALEDFVVSNMRVSEEVLALIILDAKENVLVSAGNRKEIEVALICFYDTLACQRYQTRLFFNQPIISTGVSVTKNPEFVPPGISDTPYENEVVGRILVSLSSEQLQELQQRMLFDGLAITCVAILIASMIALFFAEGISRPISRLYKVVSAIQHGNLSARTIPSSRGELRRLEDGVNAMATWVEEANTNLQQQVEKATSELVQALETLESKNRDLEKARAKSEAANRTKDLFLARMSHELRTPLASVIGYSRLQETAEDSAKRKDYGRVVEQASKILLATIDDILDFIRLEDESIRLENIDFDLRDCIENVVAMQAPEAERKKLDLICDFDDNLPTWVCGDSARLAQIVTNLLSNAIKFTDRGQVRLHASATYPNYDKARIQIVVTDTGIGIPKDKQSQLFQPFTQADESISRRFGGSGLGLSITRKLAQYMGGDVSLRSDSGQGVEVTITVQMQLSDQHQTSPLPPPGMTSSPEGVKALVVEDNELNRQLITTQMENIGINVKAVSSGIEALGTVENEHFDVIFMDIHMPGMDGVKLAATFKEHAPDIPLYALTANITGSEEKALLDIGVRKILYKPLHEDTLKKIIEQGLEPETVPKDELATKGSSRFKLAPGIEANAVLDELERLLGNLSRFINGGQTESLFETSHRLLGIARLFTRGRVLAIAIELEDLARQKKWGQLETIKPSLVKEVNQLRYSVVAKDD